MKRIYYSFVVLSLFLVSCTARISSTVRADGSATVTLRMTVEPRMAALIRQLSAVNARTNPGNLVVNGSEIAASLSASAGVRSADLRNINPTTIEGTIIVADINKFLSVQTSQGGKQFSRYRAPTKSTDGNFAIDIDRLSGPQIVDLVSKEVSEYLAAIMAPVVTGEILSKAAYLDLVRSVYNKPIADEIAAARIRATIEFPRPVSRSQGGVFNGRRVEFDIPLIDLLVLETALHYEVSWR
ncbi:MAG: hypothetical protein LBQ77_02555 [Treponema sp.]|jgi:hypothetical protein|nr:hypothetical protein [Treponema sp.]